LKTRPAGFARREVVEQKLAGFACISLKSPPFLLQHLPAGEARRSSLQLSVAAATSPLSILQRATAKTVFSLRSIFLLVKKYIYVYSESQIAYRFLATFFCTVVFTPVLLDATHRRLMIFIYKNTTIVAGMMNVISDESNMYCAFSSRQYSCEALKHSSCYWGLD
jgi:hypothetical protein